MRLYTAAALLAGASAEVIPDGGVLVDGPRIVAAGPLDRWPPARHPARTWSTSAI